MKLSFNGISTRLIFLLLVAQAWAETDKALKEEAPAEVTQFMMDLLAASYTAGEALFMAVAANKTGVVDFLLKAGANMYAGVGHPDKTPINLAIHTGKDEIITIFKNYGYDPAIPRSKKEVGPLVVLAYSMLAQPLPDNPHPIKTLDLLLSYGANIHGVNGYDPLKMALDVAERTGDASLASALIERGAHGKVPLLTWELLKKILAGTAAFFGLYALKDKVCGFFAGKTTIPTVLHTEEAIKIKHATKPQIVRALTAFENEVQPIPTFDLAPSVIKPLKPQPKIETEKQRKTREIKNAKEKKQLERITTAQNEKITRHQEELDKQKRRAEKAKLKKQVSVKKTVLLPPKISLPKSSLFVKAVDRNAIKIDHNENKLQRQKYLGYAFDSLIRMGLIYLPLQLEESQEYLGFNAVVGHYALLYNITRCFVALNKYKQCSGSVALIQPKIVLEDIRNMSMHGAWVATQHAVLDTTKQLCEKLPQQFLQLHKPHLLESVLDEKQIVQLVNVYGLANNPSRYMLQSYPLVIEETALYKELAKYHNNKQDSHVSLWKDVDVYGEIVPTINRIMLPIKKAYPSIEEQIRNAETIKKYYPFHLDALKMLLAICGELRAVAGSVLVRNKVGHAFPDCTEQEIFQACHAAARINSKEADLLKWGMGKNEEKTCAQNIF